MRLAPLVSLPLPLLLVAMALGACGGGDEAPGEASQEPAATATATATATAETGGAGATGDAIAIVNFKYAPEEVSVEAGTTVEWTNEDAAPHTATADDGSFDTGDLRKGDAATVKFSEPGEYAYFCEFHKFMRGRIKVG